MSGTEMQFKYAVVKIEDIDTLLVGADRDRMYQMLNSINVKREMYGKEFNRYVVVNADEPYVHEIIDILKKNGHWGPGQEKR